MNKFSTLFSAFLLGSSVLAFADIGSGVKTESDYGLIVQYPQFDIGANDVTITHYRGSARHIGNKDLTCYIDAHNYTGTKLVSDETSGGTGTNCFGFNGMVFRADSNDYDITISATERASSVGILTYGIHADNVTLNVNLSGKSHFSNDGNATISAKNNAILNWNSAQTTEVRKASFIIEAGSVLNAKFDNTSYKTYLGSNSLGGKFTFGLNAVNGTINPDTHHWFFWSGASSISGQSATNKSNFNGRWEISHGATVTVSDSDEGSIIIGDYNLIMRSSTLQLNSSNALAISDTQGQENITLEVGKDCSARLELGADNSFEGLMLNSATTNTLSVLLGGNSLSFSTVSTGIIGKMYIEDFSENLVKIDSIDEKFLGEDGSVSFILAGSKENADLAQSVYWDKNSGYLSLVAVPEPAEWAMIFGAIALAFVAYRRRK
ncbi:MAG: hypothetical protein J6B07_05190 [Opitutales bacterium]|nr:hypothetical protein [Opitutales bacterium]